MSKAIYKRINTPFGYFGSKNKIALQICRNLPPHTCWVEAFCGSAALTLAKPPAPIEIINDIDGEIVNFFKQLRMNEEELCRLVALTPYARQELVSARTVRKSISSIERARRFLVASMMAINGVFGQNRGGFSYSVSYSRNGREARVNRWYNLPERISAVAERLRGVLVEKTDARKLLKRFADRPGTILYLDPPYFADRTKGYENDQRTESFHRDLLQLASKCKCMVLISGYQNELYDSILSVEQGWAKKRIKTHTKDATGKIHSRVEVLWMNKHFVQAQISGEMAFELTPRERALGKVNPAR